MKTNNIFEIDGSVIKKEILASIEHDTGNALVLETRKPYPGYLGSTIPDDLKPMSLFLVTDKKYTGEQIIRGTLKVKENFPVQFDATPAMVQVFNTMHPCIRIKNMASYENVIRLITAYRKTGLDFMKDKVKEPYEGWIKVRKYFTLKEYTPGIYYDVNEPSKAYFEIPVNLSWEMFEKITFRLKPNVDYNNFDAALAVFFTPKGVIDAIRIYHPEIDMKDILYLQSKYLEEINRSDLPE